MTINRVPVARHGLILRQDGATASSMLFIWAWSLYGTIVDGFLTDFGSRRSTIRIYPYLYIKVALSIFP